MISFLRGLAGPFCGCSNPEEPDSGVIVLSVAQEAPPDIEDSLERILAGTADFKRASGQKSSTNQPFWKRVKGTVSDLQSATQSVDKSVQEIENAYTEVKSTYNQAHEFAVTVDDFVKEGTSTVSEALQKVEDTYMEAKSTWEKVRDVARGAGLPVPEATTERVDESLQGVENAYNEAKSVWEKVRELADAAGESVKENAIEVRKEIDAELAELETAYNNAMLSTRSQRKAATVAIKVHTGSDRFARSVAKAGEVAFKVYAKVRPVGPEKKQAILFGFQANRSKNAVADSVCEAIMDPAKNGRAVLKAIDAELEKLGGGLED